MDEAALVEDAEKIGLEPGHDQSLAGYVFWSVVAPLALFLRTITSKVMLKGINDRNEAVAAAAGHPNPAGRNAGRIFIADGNSGINGFLSVQL
ncbi:hypothetical protein ACFFP0_18735 [Rhizobium puerariae]|uniref:Uncharacterized protein n=1 Tax=Rhizobium puerariae TaxID=1585791 RepID=A0ABV6AJV2_9HYPH